MGYSVAEFTRVLPLAMRDWPVSGGPPAWRVRDAAGRIDIVIDVAPQTARQIGALRVPVLRVTIRPGATAAAALAEFMHRFERGFHRGGG